MVNKGGLVRPWSEAVLFGGLGGVLLAKSLSVETGSAGLAFLALVIYWIRSETWRFEKRFFFVFNSIYFLTYIGIGLWFLQVGLAGSDMGKGYAMAVWFGACLLQALVRAPIVVAYWRMRHRSFLVRGAAICLLWTLMDFCSNLSDFWFPLLPIGYACIDSWFASLVPIGGLYLAHYAVLLGAFCCVGLLRAVNFPEAKKYLVIAIGIAVSCYPASMQTWIEQDPGKSIKVAMVQTNFPLADRYSESVVVESTKSLATQLAQVPRDVDLVILPEGVFGAMYEDIPEAFFQFLKDWSQGRDTYLAMGAFLPGLREGNRSIGFSAVLLDPQTMQQGGHHLLADARYDKHDLIPFAEKTPEFLDWWLPQSLIRFAFTRGERGRGGSFDWNVKGLRLSPSLCYEILFGESRRSAARHSGILLNMAMSRWFEGSDGLAQLRKIARMRALEARRPLLRVDHFGYTEWVSPAGAIVSSLPLGEAQTLTVSVQAYRGETPYFKWGAWVWMSAAWLVLLVCMAVDFCYRKQIRSSLRESEV